MNTERFRGFGFAAALFAASISGCSAVGFAQDRPVDGRFEKASSDVHELDLTTFTYEPTRYGVYLSLDNGRDWKCIFGIPRRYSGRFSLGPAGGCVGGSASRLVIAVASAAANLYDATGYTLFEWNPTGAIKEICETPAFDVCRFQSPELGAYAIKNQVFVTVDGGKTWIRCKYGGASNAPRPEQREGGLVVDLRWNSDNHLAIATSSSVSLHEIKNDGHAIQVWFAPIDRCEKILAETDNAIWVQSANATMQRSVVDGSLRQTLLDPPRMMYRLAEGVLEGPDVFYLPEAQFGVSKYEISNSHAKLLANMRSAGSAALLRRVGGGVLIFTDDERSNIFEWDGKAADAKVVNAKIDNSAIRRADKPGPDQPTPQELNDFIRTAIPVDSDVRLQIGETADAQKGWSRRQKLVWETAQFKAAVLAGNHWAPPALVLPPNPAMARLPDKTACIDIVFSAGYSTKDN